MWSWTKIFIKKLDKAIFEAKIAVIVRSRRLRSNLKERLL